MIRRFLACVTTLLLVAMLPTAGSAHELEPAFLALRETSPARYDVLWKVPSVGSTRMQITPVFPTNCRQLGEPLTTRVGTSWVSTVTIACGASLAGQTITIGGLSSYSTDVLVRVEHFGGGVETHVVKPVAPSLTLRSTGDTRRGVSTYFVLGVEHIASGFDHLLFVLGLLLIVRSRRTLVKTITAFTVAHSITLAAATFGGINVPSAPLNAAIALSILFLGPEIVRVWRGETSFTIRHPWAVAFIFGLLHGVGFASGLAELGLPHADIPLALLLFNVGVEAGQLAFVLLVIAMERAFRALEVRWPPVVSRVPGYAVGSLAAFWVITYVSAMVR